MRTELTWIRWLPDAPIEPELDPPLAAVMPLEVVPALPAPLVLPVVPDAPLEPAIVPVTSTSWPLCCASSVSCPSRMYVDPLIAMLPVLPLPDVPAVEPLAPDPLPDVLPLRFAVDPVVPDEDVLPAPDALDPVAPEPDVLDAPDVPEADMEPEPILALVSMYWPPAEREALDALPLVPVAPAVALLLPPCRHPVMVIDPLPEVRLPALWLPVVEPACAAMLAAQPSAIANVAPVHTLFMQLPPKRHARCCAIATPRRACGYHARTTHAPIDDCPVIRRDPCPHCVVERNSGGGSEVVAIQTTQSSLSSAAVRRDVAGVLAARRI